MLCSRDTRALLCPYCGTSQVYASPDAVYFDGPDDQLASKRPGDSPNLTTAMR
jgi:hypothetical protein